MFRIRLTLIILFGLFQCSIAQSDCKSSSKYLLYPKANHYSLSQAAQLLIYHKSELEDSIFCQFSISKKQYALKVYPLYLKNDFGLSLNHYYSIALHPAKSEQTEEFLLYLSKLKKSKVSIDFNIPAIELEGCFVFQGTEEEQEAVLNKKQLKNQLKQLKKAIRQLSSDSLAIANSIQLEAARQAKAEQELENLRILHQNLSANTQKLLAVLIQQSDSIGFALNEALISNDKASARVVAEMTGRHHKYKQEIQKESDYQYVKPNFDEYYQIANFRFTHHRNQLLLNQKMEGIKKELIEKRAAMKEISIQLAK